MRDPGIIYRHDFDNPTEDIIDTKCPMPNKKALGIRRVDERNN